MAATTALREALNEGISSGNFVDTKIILYSYRDSSGRVCRPKALYANSHVLKTVPYFNDLLFGDFAESQSRNFIETIDEEEYTKDYGYLSDSDLEDDEDERDPSTTESEAHPLAIRGGENTVVEEYKERRVEKGKVVKIPDIAFVTFQAFLMYLYTCEIEFAPFGSEENRRLRSTEIVHRYHYEVPRPSPKSIYRLADKYDVPALKALAFNHIRSQLTKCDIVGETFSRFASRYDEIGNLYLEQLAFAWTEDSTTAAISASIDEKFDSYGEKSLEHATEIIIALLEIANKDDKVKPLANTSPEVIRPASPAHWAFVKAALIKSIRRGVFFDREYWARHSNAGDLSKPVYFSSTIMNDKALQLGKCVSNLTFWHGDVLSVPSGEILQGYKPSHG
ncbi:hypothetical protein BJ322DRAFT_828220 [Thelephora terrestris]|uniref:BTB domain-containing protein n=1 Tax=Thelephora terrestris TaxID=56493 RepID=A0A9P6HGH0_9AGAM|nr:hypothetical protein BJ322DRAFT_828220 [Thelephora terrestris]